MEKLYAPWRQKYASKKTKKETHELCIFCQAAQAKKDKDYFVIKRYKTCFVILNTYPYNAGHIMVVSNKHCAELSQLSDQEQTELIKAVTESTQLLKKTLKPDGFNLGINLGSVAGAGIKDHLHVHIVPRWSGDTNFMPLIANTKHISFDLNKIYQTLCTKTAKK